jgi:hypothetical protein
MPWKMIHHQHYYYRNKRLGRRVISRYIGTGTLAECMANLDRLERDERNAEREELRQIQAADLELTAGLDELNNSIHRLTSARMHMAGYHLHKGTWRKRRKHE